MVEFPDDQAFDASIQAVDMLREGIHVGAAASNRDVGRVVAHTDGRGRRHSGRPDSWAPAVHMVGVPLKRLFILRVFSSPIFDLIISKGMEVLASRVAKATVDGKP